ncbi:hypothetical protein C8Q80DRAFT_245099 [Daedaleopsis nitida]|nr:hypothetical protein C8Q80DRAFT_245099 [Daedaleopsis nitida]
MTSPMPRHSADLLAWRWGVLASSQETQLTTSSISFPLRQCDWEDWQQYSNEDEGDRHGRDRAPSPNGVGHQSLQGGEVNGSAGARANGRFLGKDGVDWPTPPPPPTPPAYSVPCRRTILAIRTPSPLPQPDTDAFHDTDADIESEGEVVWSARRSSQRSDSEDETSPSDLFVGRDGIVWPVPPSQPPSAGDTSCTPSRAARSRTSCSSVSYTASSTSCSRHSREYEVVRQNLFQMIRRRMAKARLGKPVVTGIPGSRL